MTDPVQEIRKLRDKWAKEYWRDPQKFLEERERRFAAMVTNVVRTGPLTFTATIKPLVVEKKKTRKRPEIRKKQRIRPRQ